jgi:hypothetical protein
MKTHAVVVRLTLRHLNKTALIDLMMEYDAYVRHTILKGDLPVGLLSFYEKEYQEVRRGRLNSYVMEEIK